MNVEFHYSSRFTIGRYDRILLLLNSFIINPAYPLNPAPVTPFPQGLTFSPQLEVRSTASEVA